MSTSPSPGSGTGACVSSKLPRLGAPSGLLFSRTWRLTPATIEPLPRLRAKHQLPGRRCREFAALRHPFADRAIIGEAASVVIDASLVEGQARGLVGAS